MHNKQYLGGCNKMIWRRSHDEMLQKKAYIGTHKPGLASDLERTLVHFPPKGFLLYIVSTWLVWMSIKTKN